MTPWVLRLLIANIVMYLLAPPQSQLFFQLALVPATVLHEPWTLITYMFLHGSITHILFNMIGLFFFGPRVEARIGSRDFLLLYFIAGITGGLLSFLLAPTASVVGASGAIFGVLLAFARYWPHERIYIWGVLPVPARILVVAVTALSLFGGFSGVGGGIAHFAHLGGFVGAWGFLKLRDRRSKSFQRKATPGADPSAMERLSGKAARDEKKWDDIRLDDLHEINRQEVERVRAKIAEQGSASLTPDERAFMNRMAG